MGAWHRLGEFCTSVERLAWTKASGCPWCACTCALAASGGRLCVAVGAGVVLLVKQDDRAAMHWRQEVLKWARQHGCPCDATTAHAPL